MSLVLVTFLKSCPAWIVVGLHIKSAKNCDLQFTYDEDVDLLLKIFLFNFTSYSNKITIFLKWINIVFSDFFCFFLLKFRRKCGSLIILFCVSTSKIWQPFIWAKIERRSENLAEENGELNPSFKKIWSKTCHLSDALSKLVQLSVSHTKVCE